MRRHRTPYAALPTPHSKLFSSYSRFSGENGEVQYPPRRPVIIAARIQTVHQETNPRYHALLRAFERLTGCPVIVNTSFNVRGEPIVCTPEDAFHCFMGTGIEALAIGNCFLRKEDQDPALKQNYETAFELD